MSGQLRTQKSTDFYTTEEIQRLQADDKRAEINFESREEQKNAAKRIGLENQALAAGKNSAAGKRIERVLRRSRDLFGLISLRGMHVAMWSALINDLSRTAVPPVAVLSQSLTNALRHPDHSVSRPYCYNDPDLLYVFEEMAVPLAVKAQLDAEIKQIEAAQKIVENRFEHSGFMGPFIEEKDVYDLKSKYAIRSCPITGKCAHAFDRVDLLMQRELERNPHSKMDRHQVFVYFAHVRNPDGSMGQRVHISHSLNDMDGETVTSIQACQNKMAAQPVPSGP